MSQFNPAVVLKALGKIPSVAVDDLGNLSLTPQAVEESQEVVCLSPDAPDAEVANLDPDDWAAACAGTFDGEGVDDDGNEAPLPRCIQKMHQRQMAATGRGSWPANFLYPDPYPHQGYHAYRHYIEREQFLRNGSLHREMTDEEWQRVVVDARVWPNLGSPVKSVAECKRTFIYGGERVASFDRPEWAQASDRKDGQPFTVFDLSTWICFETARRCGLCPVEVFDGPNGTHNLHEKMIRMSGSLQGYAYFNDGTATDHVTSNMRSNRDYTIDGICWLRAHEGLPGHCDNLQHQFGRPQAAHASNMSYYRFAVPYQGYRLGVDPYWIHSPGNSVEDRSWPVLRRFHGDNPEGARPPVEPGEPPTGNEIQSSLSVEMRDGKPWVSGTAIIPASAKPTEIIIATEHGKLTVAKKARV